MVIRSVVYGCRDHTTGSSKKATKNNLVNSKRNCYSILPVSLALSPMSFTRVSDVQQLKNESTYKHTPIKVI